MIVRVVIPLPRADAAERQAVRDWLQRVLERRIAVVEVSQRNDQGIVIRAGFETGFDGLGALEAAAGILELAHRALEEDIGRGDAKRRRELQTWLSRTRRARITVDP